ncbi:3-hydroxyacyl-CoA dehydrogenase [Capronia coronata CBS 617.96]|uniref:3-hydroxyacyl-CoA dehydrogenase n=1 Tax=Capronia coronata CBS 617.96 TaxID=1182541 RepID=W9XTR6_9EURO|nr:3-hydroxyacyl-CoA dehydrogenase [Capronia coronata CBS 617.96]EXJ83633.1 3-hydroxyacyl-CoA dehydrogenase [Capronia coronata CBS 617.96]
MSQQIRTVAVIGCGVIGMSWACLFLAKGLKVIITDPVEGAEDRFRRYLDEAWPSIQLQLGSLQQEPAKNYEFVADIVPRLIEVDFIQENGPERVEFKQELFKTLDQHARPGVVIASSSSGLPSSAFIGQCEHEPGRILIGHPFNPPHLIPLVEVVPHAGTTPAIITTAMAFYRALGKRPVLIRKEVPGFVANRLQAAINAEAYSLISRGVISAEDLDTAVTSGPGLRWGVTGPIVTNALGGGGGADGFNTRLERLGPAIRGWEKDMLEHRFDWSEERLSLLKAEVGNYLTAVNWSELTRQRDSVLLQLLKSKPNL